MPTSLLLRVNPVVLGVRAHEPDVDHPIRVVDLHHEPVSVAPDVEHHTVVADDARGPVLRLDLRGGIPILLLDFAVPREKGLLHVRVQLPELAEGRSRHDPHGRSYIGPIYFSSRMIPKCTLVDMRSILAINILFN